ncbi:MAG TPA: PilZ domain-containing protein [Candidatus Acidoferrales bacterium]|nr:PilZ domain-containing protein [Candidatus Acidoferrales bacterium]
MRPPAGRSEQRAQVAVTVRLIAQEDSSPWEMAHTENVSSRGARVVTMKVWQTGKSALVRSTEGQFEWIGRVVYCQRLPDGQFAVGLQRSSM